MKEAKLFLIWIIFSMPGRLGVWLRNMYLRSRLSQFGDNISTEAFTEFLGGDTMSIGSGTSIRRFCSIVATSGGQLKIGDRVCINSNTTVNAADGGRILIGDDVIIAQNVVIRASDHVFSDTSKPISAQGHKGGYIEIGAGSWIGANVVIVKNVRIGKNVVVGAGSVVTKDIPDRAIAVGVPARVLKSIT